MAYYEWSCNVCGTDDGVVKAKSKSDALKKARREVEWAGMNVDGEISIIQVKKKDNRYYEDNANASGRP